MAAAQEGGQRNWPETPERKKPHDVHCSIHSANTGGAGSGRQVTEVLRESRGWRDREAAEFRERVRRLSPRRRQF